MTTDVTQFITDLDGGVFEEKLSHAISEVAGAVLDHGEKSKDKKQGKIVITLDIVQIGAAQVMVDHELKFTRPTSKGKITETSVTRTPMNVGSKGRVTLFPEGQGQLFDKKGGINKKTDKETSK